MVFGKRKEKKRQKALTMQEEADRKKKVHEELIAKMTKETTMVEREVVMDGLEDCGYNHLTCGLVKATKIETCVLLDIRDLLTSIDKKLGIK